MPRPGALRGAGSVPANFQGRQYAKWLGMPVPIVLGWSYGTIGGVTDHRVRLTDDDVALIVSSLRARAAMTNGARRHRIERLASRLAEGGRGNPKFSLGEYEQTHEDEIDDFE